ncbi:sensor histidine kinase [Kamptonema formosum]|uniref:sensor histidine kinase n=1 Tax=Kamptonema formosum TaxID=331992 RepID=UPI000348A0BA|nr:HAMP domain-containing sensor histidine kinase [Oscillatoria sp. PCC 10802]
MDKWFLPTVSEILALAGADGVQSDAGAADSAGNLCHSRLTASAGKAERKRLKAEREWFSAISALSCLLQQDIARTPIQRAQLSRLGEGSSAAQSYRLQRELQHPLTPAPLKGLVLSGPHSHLSHPALVANYSAWTFTCAESHLPALPLPAGPRVPVAAFCAAPAENSRPAILPLLPADPLTNEKFCVILTPHFSLAIVLGAPRLNPVASVKPEITHNVVRNQEQPRDSWSEPAFQFSFDPEVVWQVWQALRPRAALTSSASQFCDLDSLVEQFAPCAPHYKTVTQFAKLLLEFQPEPAETESHRIPAPPGVKPAALPAALDSAAVSRRRSASEPNPIAERQTHSEKRKNARNLPENDAYFAPAAPKSNLNPEALNQRIPQLNSPTGNSFSEQSPPQDVELLQALAHEVRTPLTTIRTLTRLLLKRPKLEAEVRKRLEMIDRECTEQIDRFSLIFRAVELETSQANLVPVRLTPTSLAAAISSCIPRWQKQASRRNITLDVVLPQKMPSVVSDPTMLDQVLTGLIENVTSSLPLGSHIQLQVIPAGHQLKVQLQSQADSTGKLPVSGQPAIKSIGQLLMFQPETGNLSLNLSVTKNLFQALGGKLIVRHKPQQGEVLTIFLPLE